MQNEALTKIFLNSRNTISNWRKEQRPIIKFFDKYFNEDDIEEFLSTGRILKMEQLRDMHFRNITLLNNYANLVDYPSLHTSFLTQYFSLLQGSKCLKQDLANFITNYPNMPRKTEYLSFLFELFNNDELLLLLQSQIQNNFQFFNQPQKPKLYFHYEMFNRNFIKNPI